jgi:hypothetical protein
MLNVLILLAIGIILLIIYINKYNSCKCPKRKIEYRFIPRTFLEKQENPVYPNELFYSMFYDSDIGYGREKDSELFLINNKKEIFTK